MSRPETSDIPMFLGKIKGKLDMSTKKMGNGGQSTQEGPKKGINEDA